MEEHKKTPAKKPTVKKKPTATAEIKTEEQLEATTATENAVQPEQKPKKPAAKKKPAVTVKSKTEKQPENTDAASVVETAPTAAENVAQPEQKPKKSAAKKKSTGTTAKAKKEEQTENAEVAASVERDASVTEPSEEALEVRQAEQPVVETEATETQESAQQEQAQPSEASEQEATAQNVEQPKSSEPTEQSAKPAKKRVLSKKSTIILSCVLAVILIAIIIAVSVISCNGGAGDVIYTVTFDTLGGSSISSYKLAAGSKINPPKNDPTKEMFTFDGWYIEVTNSQGKKVRQKFVFGTTISRNITLYANWKGDVSVRVEFDPNGGKFEDGEVVSSVLVGSPVSEPEQDPTRFGYDFDGWYTEADCKNKYQFSTSLTVNTTLYAGWKENSDYVYVSYYGNGKLLQVKPVLKGDDVEIPELFKPQDEITITGWYTDNKQSVPYTAGKATEDISLYTTYYTSGLVISNATVTGYNGNATDIVIPSTYNGKTVTTIGERAFYSRPSLPVQITSVTLPSTINRISNEAFYNCQYLANINLTENVASIGADAFYRNIRLRTVGDMSGVISLGAGAFNGCYMLGEVTLSNAITSIGAYTFNDCRLLNNVTVPASVMTIGEYAFSGCTSLKTVVVESLIINTVGKYAFKDCTNLTEVTVKKTSGAVAFAADGNPFAGCRSVTIFVPSSLVDEYKNNPDNESIKDKIAAIR